MVMQRILSAVILIPFLVVILLVSNTLVMNIALAVFTIIGLYEVYKSLGFWQDKPLVALGFIAAVLFAFSNYITSGAFIIVVLIYVVVLSVVLFFFKRNITIQEVSLMFFITFYFCYFLSLVIKVRDLPYGNYYIWLVFIGAFVTDTAAFFVGRFFGKNKLLPEVSPKKTIEGALGGVVTTTLVFLAIGAGFSAVTGLAIHYLNLGILGFLCSIFAQAGDLFASVIKREYGLKDFGSFMPGHGGVLDRLDSVLFVAPLVYGFLSYFQIILV